MLTIVRSYSLSLATWIHSTSSHCIHFNIVIPSMPKPSKSSLPFSVSGQTVTRIPHLSYTCYMHRPPSPPWFNHLELQNRYNFKLKQWKVIYRGYRSTITETLERKPSKKLLNYAVILDTTNCLLFYHGYPFALCKLFIYQVNISFIFPVVPNWNIGSLSGFLWSHIYLDTR
jgi:hypothetical protein